MLSVNDLRFSYGSREILKGISFEAEKNTVVSILGPNGTGKSTFFKCICKVLKPDGGNISVDGTDIMDLKGRELSKKIGYVPQTSPASRISVFDAILLGRRPYIDFTVSRNDTKKVGEVIDMLGLSDLSLKYLDEISGGEFQKVQIARALVQEPSVLILDEPTSNLDIANQHRTMHMIEDAVRSRGMCTIMTMHDINLAVHYSDRFLFLKDGNVEAYGGSEIITEDLIRKVYGMETSVVMHHGVPFVIPEFSNKYHKGDHDIHDHLLNPDYKTIL